MVSCTIFSTSAAPVVEKLVNIGPSSWVVYEESVPFLWSGYLYILPALCIFLLLKLASVYVVDRRLATTRSALVAFAIIGGLFCLIAPLLLVDLLEGLFEGIPRAGLVLIGITVVLAGVFYIVDRLFLGMAAALSGWIVSLLFFALGLLCLAVPTARYQNQKDRAFLLTSLYPPIDSLLQTKVWPALKEQNVSAMVAALKDAQKVFAVFHEQNVPNSLTAPFGGKYNVPFPQSAKEYITQDSYYGKEFAERFTKEQQNEILQQAGL